MFVNLFFSDLPTDTWFCFVPVEHSFLRQDPDSFLTEGKKKNKK